MNPDGGDESQSQPGPDDEGNSNAVVEEPQQPIASPSQQKLSSMVLGDGGFEEMMKERSRSRKEKEEHALAQVMVQLTSAERALSMETQRRVESTHALQKACTKRVQEMERNFKRILNERSLYMKERLVFVQQKVDELATRFEEEKEVVPKDMEARGKELKAMLETFQKELAEERGDRLNRAGKILKQMDDNSSAIFSSIEKEMTEREQISEGLQTRIDDNEKFRSQSENDLQSKIQNEMAELKEMIEMEEKERSQGDDAIISALNQYTQHLQASLSVISS